MSNGTDGGESATTTEQTIGCPVCTSFSTTKDVEQTLERHNKVRHDGDKVAHIITPDSEECVNEFVDTAREKAPSKQYKRLIQRIVRGETPYTVATVEA